LTTSGGNEHHGQKMVMMTHDLFETCGHFHLLLNAEEKPNQALAGPSIWLLCDHNRSAVEILEQDLTTLPTPWRSLLESDSNYLLRVIEISISEILYV